MDIVVGNIFNDIINFKNKKINISIMCQRIFYYIQEYLKPTKYSEEDILKISCHVADIIEYNLNKLENENKLLYMNTKDIFKLINDLIYESKIV
tara:strand:- start:3008 stop:3289 length:282 start_codon:yes stop_codon:yes gene_type:complete